MKVSVALVTYNHEKYIADAIESVLKQQVDFDYEIIIGDDCSSDRTRNIILAFKKRYPYKFKLVFSKTNQGHFGRENIIQTINACSGDYVAYLDGDDFWTSTNKLQLQVDLMEKYPEYSSCFHSVKRIYEDGHSDYFVPPGRKITYSIDDVLTNFTFIHTASFMFRRESLGGLPHWFSSITIKVDDWTLYVLCARNGPIAYINENMAIYRKHQLGLWSGITHINQLLWDVETRETVNAYIGRKLKKKGNRQLFRNHLVAAQNYLNLDKSAPARKHLIKCIINFPFRNAYSPRYLMIALIQLYLPRIATRWLVQLKSILTHQETIKLIS